MGLIDKIKNKLPFGGQPESDLSVADFESEQGGNQEDNETGEDSEEDDSENENGNSENEESEENESEENESGNGESEEDDSENEENLGENGESEENEGGQGENEDSSQGNNEDSNESENELEDMKSEMDESSAERDMDDWDGYDGDESSNLIKQHYDNLQEKRSEPSTEIGLRKQERDERIEDVNNYVSSEKVQEKYQERFADEIREAFRKIKTREAPKAAEYGQRINMRGVIRRRSGDPTEERLYLEMDQSEVGDRCITVVVDSSGSMDELEIKLALMALADACEQIGDRFTATNYSTEDTRSNNPTVKTNLITAPTEKFKNEHLDSFKAHGYTPTSSGIRDGRALADITPNSEDVIIVITDGVANVDIDENLFSEDINNDAMDEASKQFNAAVNEGKRVIGIGVGQYLDDKCMQKIFGNSYIRTDMDKIADSLVDIYRDQMKTVKN